MYSKKLWLAVLIAVMIVAAPMAAHAGFPGTKICIDPGHGGSDPGAVALGDRESDINLDIGLRMRTLFQQDGATIIMTRTSDVDVSLQGRCDIANNNGCSSFLCTHCNAGGGTGTETYCYATGTTAATLAGKVQTELCQHMATTNRGVKTAGYYVLLYTNMPAILGEVAFIDTQADNDKLSSPTYRQEAARAYLHGTQSWYGYTPHDPVSDIIVDNTSGSFSVTGTWATGSSSTDKYGTDYRYHSTANVTDAALWKPALPNGNYTVYAWWPQGSNRSTTAPYTVRHNFVSTVVNENQQANGGKWNSLGTYNFINGDWVNLTCNTTTGFNVMADAIKFVPQY